MLHIMTMRQSIIDNQKKQVISVSHINFRESISFLIIKLIVIELISSVLILALWLPLAYVEISFPFVHDIFTPQVLIFIVLTLSKLFLSLFVILLWLNEYYEITPTQIIHRSGIIFRHEERYELATMGSINVIQGIISKFLNYGTLYFFNRTVRKYVYFPLIHNPIRYYRIIESLLPPVNKTKEIIREHVLEEQDEEL